MQTYLSLVLAALVTDTTGGNNSGLQYGYNAANLVFENGFGGDQADTVYEIETEVAASTTATYDLAGSLTNKQGQTVTFAKVKMVLLINFSTTQTLTLGAGASNGWAGMFAASGAICGKRYGNAPGMIFGLNPVGAAVTAGTGDILSIANGSGSTAKYKLVIIGTSV